jgi:DNA mismatch repair protein MutS2
MNAKVLGTLEFPKVLARLAEVTAFSASRELALALEPSADRFWVERRQEETAEAVRLLQERPEFSVRGTRDVRLLARKAALGGVLDPAQLLEVAGTLESGQFVGGTLAKLESDTYRVLREHGTQIHPCRDVTAAIGGAISDQGEVRDNASPALGRIRRELRVAHSRLTEKLNSYLSSHRSSLQDAIITSRNDRYVLPIRAEARSQIPGIVHDQSASGATVFVEPLAIVELNNALRTLQLQEQAEIERILRAVSGVVGTSGEAIIETVNALAAIDLCLAKARLAGAQDASRPLLSAAGRLALHKARHPLLTGTVVPISIELGNSFSQLVITGPNTGGKTVALKTVGLLTLMALSGLHIPAEPGSEVGLAPEVWADIGDEQSIEQSLSTFSSHMTNIVRIVNAVRAGDLVLLDELGAGTDPVEGAALARAILDELRAKQATTVATTHYAELKAYAHSTPGVRNASVEFDLETLSPTYRLTVGLPGRSNALAIATRLGLNKQIVDAATATLAPEQLQIETLLKQIADEKQEAERARAEAQRLERQAAAALQATQRERAALERERERLLQQAETAAEQELADFRRQLAELQMRAGDVNSRRDVQAVQEQSSAVLRQLLERSHKQPRRREAPPTDLPLGSWVHIETLGQSGKLLSLDREHNSAEVQLGSFKVRAKASELSVGHRPAPLDTSEAPPRRREPAREERVVTLPAVPVAGTELDLRGKRAADVDAELDRFLNDASRAGLPYARIIHGKGTGALRQVVLAQLTGHPLVTSFRLGEAGEGGDGVTIATL